MKNQKFFDDIAQLATVYSVGSPIGLSFQSLVWTNLVEVIHSERFPHFRGKVIIVSNHPSLMEPLLIVCLCWIGYLLHPFRLAPVGVIDGINLKKRNIYGGRWLWWIRRFVISVSRNSGNNKESFKEMLAVLKAGRRIIIFPEAGRTSTGGECEVSPSGHKIRKVLAEGCIVLAQSSGAPIVPIWFDWNVPDKIFNIFFPFRKLLAGKLTIIIGKEFYVDRKEDRAVATLRLRDTLLNLAETHIKK